MGDWADDCEREADFREEEALEFLKKVNEAQAAVIEAAKALAVLREFRFRYMGHEEGKALVNLRKKVEALQEVEGE